MGSLSPRSPTGAVVAAPDTALFPPKQSGCLQRNVFRLRFPLTVVVRLRFPLTVVERPPRAGRTLGKQKTLVGLGNLATMQSPARRALLGALATLPLTACLGNSGPGTATAAPPTDSPTTDRTTTTPPANQSGPMIRQPGEAYETGDVAVTVSGLAVRHGMVKFGSVHPDPIWKEGFQFLLASVAVEGDEDPATLDVTMTADTLDERPDRYYRFAPDTPESVQPLGFAVPTDPAPSEASIVWHGPREVRWRIPDELVTRLGRAPDFSLEGFRAPESAPRGTSLGVTVEVANNGDRDGRFLAELGNAATSDQPEIAVSVPAGETVTSTQSVDARFAEGEMTVLLRWEGGVQRRTVTQA